MPKYLIRAVGPGLFSGTEFTMCAWLGLGVRFTKMVTTFSSHLHAAEMTPFMYAMDANVHIPLVCVNCR